MVERLVGLVSSIPAVWMVSAVFLLSACETAFVFGFVLPGELTVFLGGAAASGGSVSLAAVCLAATLGPLVGDGIGYRAGRHHGQAILKKRFPRKWAGAEKLLKRHGGIAVFLGRFAPGFRTMIPLAAGAARMPASKYFLSVIPAAVVWGSGSTLLGFAAARSFSGSGVMSHLSWGVAAVAIGGLFFLAHRYLSQGESRGAR